MSIKPILFNTDMVRAILENRKTVTTRAVKLSHLRGLDAVSVAVIERNCNPPYRPGDILYVRETFFEYKGNFYYKADGKHEALAQFRIVFKWRPSIHMPREAARIFLRVTDVRVERLQDITELDILEREGVRVDFPQPKPTYMSLAYTETRLKPAVKKAFSDLWNSTIKPADLALYGWDANPWVWVIEFERIRKEDAVRC